jgi:hypothetical protein
MGAWKRLGLIVGAPFLGLAYVIVLPFAGVALAIGLPLWYGGKALVRRVGGVKTWLRNVALFFAAPFVGLAYIMALPFVLLGMFAWMGIKSARKHVNVS